MPVHCGYTIDTGPKLAAHSHGMGPAKFLQGAHQQASQTECKSADVPIPHSPLPQSPMHL